MASEHMTKMGIEAPLLLSPKLLATFTKAVRMRYPATDSFYKGACAVNVCLVCGEFAWRSSDTDKEDCVVFYDWADEASYRRDRGCNRCLDFARRFPDVADYFRTITNFQNLLRGQT